MSARRRLSPLMLLVLSLVVAGCSEDRSKAIDLPDEVRTFDGYQLYYAGDSYKGLPLTFAELGPGRGEGLRRAWSFAYGDCELPEGEGGCPLPLEIQNWSICTRFPALYPGPTPQTETVRGAETLPAGGGLDLYTGRTTIVIFGQGKNKRDVVKALRPVGNAGKQRALPPPSPAALEGELPCQRGPMKRVSR